MIRWQPGYVYPPVFYPPHPALDALSAIVFACVAIGIAMLTFRRSANGVAALIAVTPFAYAHYIAGTSITLSKAALAGFVVALLVQRPALGMLRDPRALRLLAALAGLLGAMLLSGLFAEHREAVAREVAKWIEYGIIFIAALVAFASDPDDRPIWRTLAGVTALVAVLGLAQEFIGAPSGEFVRGIPIPRIAGPLEGPNQFSGWLGIALPMLFARVLVHRDGWLVGAAVLAAIADALTLSRSGIAAVALACVVVLIVTRPPRVVRFRFAGGALAIGGILVVLGLSLGFQARFFSLAEVPQPDHLGNRAELWRAALDLWRMSPIVGIGAGNYELELGRVGLPDVHTHANSIYLQSLAETGIVGFLATLALVWASIQTFAGTLSRRPLVIGVLGASVCLALHQVFDYLVFFPKVGEFWWLVLAIGVVEVINARNDARPLEAAA